MRSEFGDVLLVPFPFTDQSAVKKRPAVVVSSAAYHSERLDVIVMAVTSQISTPPRTGEVVLENWRAAGLPKPSMAKPVLATIERRIVVRKLGALDGKDATAVRTALQAAFG